MEKVLSDIVVRLQTPDANVVLDYGYLDDQLENDPEIADKYDPCAIEDVSIQDLLSAFQNYVTDDFEGIINTLELQHLHKILTVVMLPICGEENTKKVLWVLANQYGLVRLVKNVRLNLEDKSYTELIELVKAGDNNIGVITYQ